ncbi:solute carrier family 16, member [Geosmithia morbida]|uniref:Solute carrier family 16, member n=1 Tax=Geosmithia morbida TaxID=1094350 RepID=A0A9P5D3A8_9HYPO|nr:solute carrier family 16, member [Geosmithia morbida]KAF4125988.1 solute carrier family 16, member [Geosmithia morbida]
MTGLEREARVAKATEAVSATPDVVQHPLGANGVSTPAIDIESTVSAWICVLGSFLFMIPTFVTGMMQSVGTFQSYLHLNQLQDYSAGDVGWITGMYMFLGMFASIQVGPLIDQHGPRILSVIGAVSVSATFFMFAECKTYWQFMLCFGVFGGLSLAIACTIGVTVVSKIFVRNKGLAVGLSMTGSSVGAVIFPIVLRSLLPKMGWAWSIRIIGFLVIGVLTPAILCLVPYTRLSRLIASPTGPSVQPKKISLLDFRAFRSVAFTLVAAEYFMIQFVISGISGLLPVIATGAGLTVESGYTLLSIVGGASAFGRVIPGTVGDRVGHFNVLLVMTAVSFILLVVMFVPFGSNSRVLYAFSALWGFCSGSFLSILPVCVSKTCEAKEYGRYYGSVNFVVSFALMISIPANGTMIEEMGLQALGGLLAGVLAIGGICLFAARAQLLGTWFSLKTAI